MLPFFSSGSSLEGKGVREGDVQNKKETGTLQEQIIFIYLFFHLFLLVGG